MPGRFTESLGISFGESARLGKRGNRCHHANVEKSELIATIALSVDAASDGRYSVVPFASVRLQREASIRVAWQQLAQRS